MITGYLPMTADLFHIGHLRAIKQAKKKCDYLIVGLLDYPNYKKTVIPYRERKEILLSLPWVNRVIRQTSLRMELCGVDVVFSGDGFEKEELKSIKEYNCKIVKINYYNGQSTTKIKNKIKKIICSSRTQQIN